MRVFVDANLLVYLNVGLPAEEAELLHTFWAQLLKEHDLYTNVLVLDETLYVSRRRYGVPYEATIEFIDRAVIPFVELLPLGLEEYAAARRYIEVNGLKPSDALHAATVEVHKLHAIASEDRDFDKAGLKRIWLET